MEVTMNVWKVGMNYTDPDLMLENNLAYVFGDSMETYLNNRSLADVEEGDIVILAKSTQAGISKIGIVRSEPYYCLNKDIDESTFRNIGIESSTDVGLISKFKEKNHTDVVYFLVKWLSIDPKNLYANFLNTYGFTKVKDSKNIINAVNNFEKMDKILKILIANKNLILTGAPGTGKTYLAKQMAEKLIISSSFENSTPIEILSTAINSFELNVAKREEVEQILLQFHNIFPMTNIRNLTLDNYCIGKGDKNNFCWWMETGLTQLGSYAPAQRGSLVYGIFFSKDQQNYRKREIFNEKSPEETLNKILESISNSLISNENAKLELLKKYYDPGFLLKILSSYKMNDYIPIHSLTHIDNIIDLFSIKLPPDADQIDKSNVIFRFYKEMIGNKDITTFEFMSLLYNTFNIKDGEMKNKNQEILLKGETAFVQFHPSYDYTDFVEGLRPVMRTESNDIGFELTNGIFKQFCLNAKNNPNKNFVFIIDEINRAEISKVFGELFFSIDPEYRGEKGKVKTQYSNIQTEKTYFTDIHDDYFYVPTNVYIIGTMNDIDRSVESFDFAMRRRFAWEEITSQSRISMWEGIIDKYSEEAGKRMESLNIAIQQVEGLSSSYHIGPAYFLKLQQYDGDFQKLWDNHIGLLIKEYLRGMPDAEKKIEDIKTQYDLKGEAANANNGQ